MVRIYEGELRGSAVQHVYHCVVGTWEGGGNSVQLMVAPTTFAYNPQAQEDNKMMSDLQHLSAGEIRTMARS